MAFALAVLPLGIGLNRANAADAAVLLVSRKRLLNDTSHARALLTAEIELTAELQRRIDAIKEELNAEEQELTRLRATLGREEFDERVAAFDLKIRSQRRESQQQAAALQNVFRVERQKLVDALEPLLEAVRAAHGASVIFNADQALALDPALNVTDEVLERFNAEVPPPTIPDIETFTYGPNDNAPIEPVPDGEPPQQ